jgi:hypothetical protein
MMNYDDSLIGDARGKALEARKKFYDENPDKLKKRKQLTASAPSLGECNAHYAHANALYGAAVALWGTGHNDWADQCMQEAERETHAGHACIDAIIHENPFG